MLVDLDVALGVDREVHQPVLRPRLQHVAEERDRRLHLRGAGAVEVEEERDLRLLGLALDARLPGRRLGTHAHAPLPPSLSSRKAAALPCPARPSMRVSVFRCGAAARSPPREYSMTLERFTKSSVESGEANRAVPAVGSTWLGPAT